VPFAYTLYRRLECLTDGKLTELSLPKRIALLDPEFKTEENIHKIGAYSVAVETNRFENDYRVFEKVCLALNDRTVDPFELSPPSVAEIAWALFEIRLKKPRFKFSNEVSKYAVSVLKSEGFW